MADPFIDTNFFLNHLLQNDPIQGAKATAVFQRIERGELSVVTSDTVIFETVFTLQRGYKVPKQTIADGVLPLIELPGISLPGKRSYRKVFAMYLQGPLGFADCYHVALMERLESREIFSFDTHFDKVTSIARREE